MNQPQITPELVASHGLKPDEYERILKLIGRVPSFTELGIFSARGRGQFHSAYSFLGLAQFSRDGGRAVCERNRGEQLH